MNNETRETRKEGPKSTVISTGKFKVEQKTIHVDFKKNSGGRFLQIAELSNDRRSTVVIPFSGLSTFIETLQKVASEGGGNENA